MYEIALALSLFCAVGVGFYYFTRPVFSLFHPFTYYFMFHALCFVVRPIVAYVGNYDTLYYAYGFTPSASDKLTVIFASNLGFMTFALFCLGAGNVPMAFRNDPFNDEERRRLKQIFVWALAICLPPALYSLRTSAISFAQGVYIEGLVLDRGTGNFVNTVSNGYLTDSQMMLVTLTAILAWLGRFRPLSLIPFVLYIVFRSGTGSRGPFIAAMFIGSLFFIYEKRIRFPRPRVMLMAFAVIALFRVVGDDRGALVRQTIGVEETETVFTGSREPDQRFLESMDYANMEFFEFLVYVVPQHSGTYDFFLDNLQVFTEPVPRVLWKGKPVGEPLRRIFIFDFGFPIGMTRSLPGEGWYAAGWVGVVLWCGFWGWALGTIYRRFAEGHQTTFQVACYCVFTPTLILFYRDGQLISLAKQSGIYFAPVGVWYLAARYFALPKAADLRARAQAQWAQEQATASPDQPSEQAEPSGPAKTARKGALARHLAQLPAAARRRRLALMAPDPTPG